ncbi:MAG: hypothetical protein ABI091_24100 [Ferruginibacter sp.]
MTKRVVCTYSALFATELSKIFKSIKEIDLENIDSTLGYSKRNFSEPEKIINHLYDVSNIGITEGKKIMAHPVILFEIYPKTDVQ